MNSEGLPERAVPFVFFAINIKKNLDDIYIYIMDSY